MSFSVLNALRDNPLYLARMRMLAVGDVAFDRTFRCRVAPSNAHATHGGLAQTFRFRSAPAWGD
jgi:hypothetical protein